MFEAKEKARVPRTRPSGATGRPERIARGKGRYGEAEGRAVVERAVGTLGGGEVAGVAARHHQPYRPEEGGGIRARALQSVGDQLGLAGRDREARFRREGRRGG